MWTPHILMGADGEEQEVNQSLPQQKVKRARPPQTGRSPLPPDWTVFPRAHCSLISTFVNPVTSLLPPNRSVRGQSWMCGPQGEREGGGLAWRSRPSLWCLSAGRGPWRILPSPQSGQQGKMSLTSLSRLVAHSKESSGDLEMEDALVCMMGLKDHTLMTPSTSRLATLLPEQSTLTRKKEEAVSISP